MRPKKRILLYCPDPDKSSEISFLLKIKGFDVHSVITPASLRAAVKKTWDAALVIRGCEAAIALIQRRKTPVLVQSSFAGTLANRWIHADAPMIELVEAVKIMAARKRGPKTLSIGAIEAAK